MDNNILENRSNYVIIKENNYIEETVQFDYII